MSIVTPTVRKHLSADALFDVVRSGFAGIPDPRCADVDISLTDTLMANAFASGSRPRKPAGIRCLLTRRCRR